MAIELICKRIVEETLRKPASIELDLHRMVVLLGQLEPPNNDGSYHPFLLLHPPLGARRKSNGILTVFFLLISAPETAIDASVPQRINLKNLYIANPLTSLSKTMKQMLASRKLSLDRFYIAMATEDVHTNFLYAFSVNCT